MMIIMMFTTMIYDLVDHGGRGDHDHDNHDNDRPGGAHQPDRDE